MDQEWKILHVTNKKNIQVDFWMAIKGHGGERPDYVPEICEKEWLKVTLTQDKVAKIDFPKCVTCIPLILPSCIGFKSGDIGYYVW